MTKCPCAHERTQFKTAGCPQWWFHFNKCLNSRSHLISVYLLPTVEEQLRRTKRDAASPPPVDSQNVHFVLPGVAFYLSCPIHSYHAVYTWEHGDKNSLCLQMQSNCLHLIPVMTQESYGNYRCISREKGYTKVVKQYQLVQREIQDTNTEKNASPAILGQTLRNLLLALTVILCCVETWLFSPNAAAAIACFSSALA